MALPPGLLDEQENIIGREMADEQSGDNRILAHFTPEELAMLDDLQGGISIDPETNLREYSRLEEILTDPYVQDSVVASIGEMGGKGFAAGGPIDQPGRPLDPELEQIRELGKGEDTELAIISTNLLEIFQDMLGEKVSVNKDTGLPQFFFPMLIPLIAAIAPAVIGAIANRGGGQRQERQPIEEAGQVRQGWGGTTSGAQPGMQGLGGAQVPGQPGAAGWINQLAPIAAAGLQAYGQHREQRDARRFENLRREEHDRERQRMGAGYQVNLGNPGNFIQEPNPNANADEMIAQGRVPQWFRPKQAAQGGYMKANYDPNGAQKLFLGGLVKALFNPVAAIFGDKIGNKIDPIGGALTGMFGGNKEQQRQPEPEHRPTPPPPVQIDINQGRPNQQNAQAQPVPVGMEAPYANILGREEENRRNQEHRARFARFAEGENMYNPVDPNAAGYNPLRERRAEGGQLGYPGSPSAQDAPFLHSLSKHKIERPGGIFGPGKGQDDRIPKNLPSQSYILDASTVSDIGDGSTRAGINELNKYFQQNLNARYMGQRKNKGGLVKVLVSDGEYAIPPEQVAALGGGSADKGAKVLHEMVMRIRAEKRRGSKKLPAKAKSVGGYIANLKRS